MTAYQRMYYYLDHAIGEALRTAVTPPQQRLSGRKKHTKSKAATGNRRQFFAQRVQ